jgi:hypothetical protein
MTDETTQAEMPVTDAAVPEMEQADSSPAIENESPQVENGDDSAPAKAVKDGVQRRIDELTRNWRQEQREKQQLLEMLHQQKPVEPTPAVQSKLPTLEEYGYDEAKYQVALLEYADKRAEAVVERRLTEADQKRAEQTRIESFVTRQKEFAKATPDFDDKVLRDPTLPITHAMRDVIIDSPAGPELAYYLAENREAAEAISKLPAHLAALEMGRIEGRLSALKEVKTRPVPVVSKAPPPAPKVDQAEVPLERSQEDMTADEWAKWREKQLRKPRK